MFLITTADERAWNKNEKVLFLGEWCKRYSRKQIWSQLDYEVLPYHWDDRTKLYQDFNYLEDVYERYLDGLVPALNQLHHCNHSVRYWRIIIGPWLRYFIEILYDRYCSINKAIASHKINCTWIMESKPWIWVPNDFATFNQFYVTDQWNHFIYGEIIKEIIQLPYNVIKEKNLPDKIRTVKQSQIKKIIQRMLSWYNRIVPDKFNSTVFVSSYFNWRDLTRLQLALKQLPYPYVPIITAPKLPINSNKRDNLKITLATNAYEKLLEKFIPIQMPTAYVEDYDVFRETALANFPKKAKAIYTANAYNSNDGFKLWAAEQVEKGTKLLISQHGGNYGTSLWGQTEDHQIAISDRFYTWGWENRQEDNIKKMPACKLIHANAKLRPNPKGDILWVQMSLPRYSYHMYSVPVASQFLNYIDEQIVFAKHVNNNVANLLNLRLYVGHDYGWDMKSRFEDAGLGKYISNNNNSFLSTLNNSRLCISTYNATTYLETFTANYPSILFWNPKHWELRPAAQPYFDELRRVGVLHDTPESAATKVNEIYADPLAWWLQPEIQAAKDRFCNEFAYVNDNWLQKWKNELDSITKSIDA